MNTCILIPTCERYLNLAMLTASLIDQRWEKHPPIFVCGVSGGFYEGLEFLPFQGDQRDWIDITRSATSQLLRKGFQKAYLILDDHPPLGICSHEYLNHTLPNLMDKLGAAYIGLYGWDQSTFSKGKVMSSEFYRLQHQDKSFLWQYSLHPALWRLEALLDISNALLIESNSLEARSIWAFERKAGSTEMQKDIPNWTGMSYRIYGLGMLGKRFRLMRSFLRHCFYTFTNGFLLILQNTLGVAAQKRFSDLIMAERLFFDGPYPLYWSGVMKKGKLNKEFEKFMTWRGRSKDLVRFQNALKKNQDEIL